MLLKEEQLYDSLFFIQIKAEIKPSTLNKGIMSSSINAAGKAEGTGKFDERIYSVIIANIKS